MSALAIVVLTVFAPSTGRLTLDKAVRTTLERHENAEIARHELDAAEARRRQVWARVLPHLNASGSVSYQPESTARVSGVGAVTTDSRTVTAGRIALSTALVDLGAIPDLQRARDAAEAQRMATTETKRLLAFATAEQFLLVLASEQLHEAATQRLQAADAAVRDAQQRADAGVGRPADVTRAQLEQSAARLGLVESTRDVDLARLTLGELLGPGGLELADDELESPTDSLLAGDAAGDRTERALAERLDLKRARWIAEAGRHAVWENLAGFLPTLTAVADLTKRDDGVVDRDLEWTASLALSWRIFEGGRKLAVDAERTAQVATALLEVQRLERGIRIEVLSSTRELEASLARLDEAEVQAKLATSNLEQATALFQNGLGTALERVDAIAAAFDADATVARRRLEARLAELGILRAVGTWPVLGVGAGE